MTQFKRVARYDHNKAADGLWFKPEDNTDLDYGQFKCALLEIGAPAWEAANDRALNDNKVRATGNGFRDPKQKSKREALQEEKQRYITSFIDMVLLDWSGITDIDGNDIPFSRKNALEFFDINDATAMFIFRELTAAAGDIRNFQPDDQEGELPEGN